MGIYNKGIEFDFVDATKQFKKFIPALGLIIAVLLILWILLIAFSEETISFSFAKNPIKNSEQTILDVKIANTSNQTARDVVVEVFAEDRRAISIAPPVTQISVLDEFRELEFVVNPVGDVLPGKYILNIQTEINGKTYSKQAELVIQK